MKYNTFTLYSFIGFLELNNTCYAYAISYNNCVYCSMLNKNNPVSLRNSNNLISHRLRPNTGNAMNSANSGNAMNSGNAANAANDDLNYDFILSDVYIPYPFDAPNISKIANTSNSTNTSYSTRTTLTPQISNTTDMVSSINNYMDNKVLKYTLGAVIIIIDKFYSYYNFL